MLRKERIGIRYALFQSPGGDSRSSDLQSRHITAEYTTIPLHVAL